MRLNHRGYTLVELLVVISIIGLVISLTLPAVMDARSAARRSMCANNLRQVGLGLQSFEAANNRFPGAYWGFVDGQKPGERKLVSFSPAGLIAYDLSGTALADRIRIDLDHDDDDCDWSAMGLDSPATLRCPADGIATGMSTNYRFCRGVIPSWPRDPGGVFVDNRGMTAAEISDGLAYTDFASERLVGYPDGSQHDSGRGFLEFPSLSTDDVASACVQANQEGQAAMAAMPWSPEPAGTSWISGRWIHNSYYHLFGPNSRWVDCRLDDRLALAVITARSNHAGGVNGLAGDGHVRFISNGVSISLWRAGHPPRRRDHPRGMSMRTHIVAVACVAFFAEASDSEVGRIRSSMEAALSRTTSIHMTYEASWKCTDPAAIAALFEPKLKSTKRAGRKLDAAEVKDRVQKMTADSSSQCELWYEFPCMRLDTSQAKVRRDGSAGTDIARISQIINKNSSIKIVHGQKYSYSNSTDSSTSDMKRVPLDAMGLRLQLLPGTSLWGLLEVESIVKVEGRTRLDSQDVIVLRIGSPLSGAGTPPFLANGGWMRVWISPSHSWMPVKTEYWRANKQGGEKLIYTTQLSDFGPIKDMARGSIIDMPRTATFSDIGGGL